MSESDSLISRGRSIEIPTSWVLLLCSISLVMASFVIHADVRQEFRTIPLILFFLGLVSLWFGIYSVLKRHLFRWMEHLLQKAAGWLGTSPGQILSLAFSLPFSLLTVIAAGFERHMYSPAAAVICWLISILLAVYGGYPVFIKRQKLPKSALAIGVLLFTGALLLRAINTATIPVVLTGDEGSSGLFAVEFLQGKIDNLFISGWFSFPTLHSFIQSQFIVLFGQTTQALRLMSAFAGALTVVLVFFIGRSMFGVVGGLAAAIFLAGMHYHIHFSRIGLNNIWDGVFIVLTLGFLWLGWQQNRRTAFLVAGIGLGLAQYFYATGRSILLIILAWLVAAGISNHSRLRKALPSIILMFWVALIISLPLNWFYANHPDEFMAPYNRVTIMGEWLANTALETGKAPFLIIIEQMWKAIQGYVYLPLIHWYMPGVPMLFTFPAFIFLLGLVLLILKPTESHSQLLFFWLAAITAAVGLSESAPAAQRYTAAAPAVALIIGFSMQQISGFLVKKWPSRAREIPAILILISLLMSIHDARFYFEEYTPNNYFGGFNGRVAQVLAERLQGEPKGQELVFCGYPYMGYHSISSLPYLAPQIIYYDITEPWGSSADPKPSGKRILFAFLPNHESDEAAVEKQYPGGSWSDHYSDAGEFLFHLYEYQESKP